MTPLPSHNEAGEGKPALVVFAGLPGVGKTTLARVVAQALPAPLLRIDAIESTLRTTGVLTTEEMGVTGYAVAAAVARDQLMLGQAVVIDAVNPVEPARALWRELAESTSARLFFIEIVCSDRAEHRRRVETRTTDLAGGYLPTWQEVLDRRYEPWTEDRLVIDTATASVADAAAAVARHAEAGEPRAGQAAAADAPTVPLTLVTGVPGSGKSTVSTALARALCAQLLAKDVVKETLFDLHGVRDRAWSVSAGHASLEVIWSLASSCPTGPVVDVWLDPVRDAGLAQRGLATGGIRDVVEILCACPGEEAASRYAARRRHPGHLPPDSVTLRRIARAAQMMEPLGVGPAIRIDTSMPIDLAALSAWVRGQR